MAQVTVYLADDLAEEVRARKEQINMSQVCSQALRAAVSSLKAIEKGDLMVDLQSLTERLKTQKQNSVGRAQEAGRAAAAAWLATAPYDRIEYYSQTRWVTESDDDGERTVVADLPHLEANNRRRFLEKIEKEGLRPEEDAYDEAWRGVVKQTWDAVKDQL